MTTWKKMSTVYMALTESDGDEDARRRGWWRLGAACFAGGVALIGCGGSGPDIGTSSAALDGDGDGDGFDDTATGTGTATATATATGANTATATATDTGTGTATDTDTNNRNTDTEASEDGSKHRGGNDGPDDTGNTTLAVVG